MREGSKYKLLHIYLHREGSQEIELTFAKVEEIIRRALPRSARATRAWWSNRLNNRAHSAAWLEAGYHVIDIDLQKERIKFRKLEATAEITYEGDRVVWRALGIRALRQHMGLTQAGFSARLAVRQQTISEWESGLYEPKRSMCKYLTLIAEQEGFKLRSS